MAPSQDTAFDGNPTTHNLPGSYDAHWDLEWYFHWGNSPWPTVIDKVDSQPIVSCRNGVVTITSQAPTCWVRRWDYEVGDPQTKISITISNPNHVPVAISSANYSIQTIGSGSSPGITTPGPGSSPVHHLIYSHTTYPNTYPNYVNYQGTSIIYSNNHPYHVPERYDYSWNVRLFSGVISWNVNCSGNSSNGDFLRLAYLPYIKAYQGSVAAGGRFGLGIGQDACDGGTNIIGNVGVIPPIADGRVFGFRKDSGLDSAGASSEYVLRAFGQIAGYYSASQRQAAGQVGPIPNLGLSFNQYGQEVSATDSFAHRRCIAHYWATIEHAEATVKNITHDPLVTAETLNLSDPNIDPDAKLYMEGDLEIISTSNNLSLNAAVFVKGNLFITSDIINNQFVDYDGANRAAVKSLYLITKGDVYIDATVKTIDAIIIAIPWDSTDPTASGNVYTCSDARTTNFFFGTNHHDRCLNQLTVNGAVVARSIILGRTFGSRNLAQPFEHPDTTLFPAFPPADNVAEIFYFSPEYYVAYPVASFLESQIDPNQYYRSDSIISLPPLF